MGNTCKYLLIAVISAMAIHTFAQESDDEILQDLGALEQADSPMGEDVEGTEGETTEEEDLGDGFDEEHEIYDDWGLIESEEDSSLSGTGEVSQLEKLEREVQVLPRYRSLSRSLIQWEKLNTTDWLDFFAWRRARHLKDDLPAWKRVLRDRRLKETVGRFLDCIGSCRIYRGPGFSQAQFRSRVQEGDEIHTLGDGHAWIFLLDGTMVRLAPHSSVTFKEINVTPKGFFFHARINSGSVLWLRRKTEPPKNQHKRETDSIFLPLSYYDANPPQIEKTVNEEDLWSLLTEDTPHQWQYETMVSLMKENNAHIRGTQSRVFLVMPTGTLEGTDVSVEFVVLIGGESYFKHRGKEQKLTFYERGYENQKSSRPEPGQWYQIEKNGRSATPFEKGGQRFGVGEFLTSWIPSILVGREMMFRKYSYHLFQEGIDADIAAQWSFRLWNAPGSGKKNEIDKRLEFLREFTRREETTILSIAKRFRQKMAAKGTPLPASVYDERFFSTAMNHYMSKGEASERPNSTYGQLNSTKRSFWKYINNVQRKK